MISDDAIEHLPPPVRRSLRRSGVVGRPAPDRVDLRQRGELLLRDRWLPFTASQGYTLDPPSFRWQAVLKLAGLPLARAEDALADGRGSMTVRVLGRFTVVDEIGPELDQGSLMRWLNETMWFPQVWASGAISWEPIDEFSANGAVRVGDLTADADFHFDPDGRLVDFRGDRYRIDAFGTELAPWATPITDHAHFDGIEVPSRGTAVWAPGQDAQEYVRVQVTDVRYT